MTRQDICSRTRRHAIATRDLVLTLVAIALLGAAVWYTWSQSDRAGDIPNDPTTWVNFKCEACSAGFPLGARDLEKALRTNGMTRPAEEGSRDLLFKCPKCGELRGRQIN